MKRPKNKTKLFFSPGSAATSPCRPQLTEVGGGSRKPLSVRCGDGSGAVTILVQLSAGELQNRAHQPQLLTQTGEIVAVLQLEEASLKKEAFTVVFTTDPHTQMSTCKNDLFLRWSCFHPAIVFPLVCTQAANEISPQNNASYSAPCRDGWVHVQNNGKKNNKTEHIVLGVAEARFGEGGRKETIHYSVENCDGSCFFSLFPHAFFHLSCDVKFLTSTPLH